MSPAKVGAHIRIRSSCESSPPACSPARQCVPAVLLAFALASPSWLTFPLCADHAPMLITLSHCGIPALLQLSVLLLNFLLPLRVSIPLWCSFSCRVRTYAALCPGTNDGHADFHDCTLPNYLDPRLDPTRARQLYNKKKKEKQPTIFGVVEKGLVLVVLLGILGGDGSLMLLLFGSLIGVSSVHSCSINCV